VSLTHKKQINIYEVNLAKTANKTANVISTFQLKENFTINKSRFILTSSFLFILNNKGDYLVQDHSKVGNTNIESKLNFISDDYQIEKFSYSSHIVFLNLEKSNIQILSLENNTISPINIEREKKEEIYYDIIHTVKKSFIYLLKKKNMNTYVVYDINLLASNNETKIDVLSKHTVNEDFKTKRFFINPYNLNMMVILSEENKIFTISKEKNYYNKIDLSLGSFVFAEIVGYYSDPSQNVQIENYKSLNQVIYQKEFSNIITNLFKIIVSDLEDVFNKIKNSLTNFNTKSEFSIPMTKTKHYLILFTESEDLVILNAFDKSLISRQNMKNKNVYKILRHTDDDINRGDKKYISIIFKEKLSDNLTAFKFNLENTELSEDHATINELLFEEEIKSQSELLVNNPSTSPVILTGKLQRHSLALYDNKFSVESKANNVYGIKYKSSNGKLEMNIAWNIYLKANTTMLSSHLPNIHANIITTYNVQGKVFYKYIDGNMLLLLSKVEAKNLLVSLVHTSSGKVLHQSLIENVDFSQKINTIFEENLVLINYVRKEKNLVRNEIFTVEMMKREIEHSFINLLEKIFKLSLWSDESPLEYASDSISETDLVFLTQTYILPRKVKEISTSKSNLNVANKYLLFLMENNSVFFLDKRIVSPRRPLMKEDKAKGLAPVLDPLNSPYIDPELVPYNPVINFDFKFLLNANVAEDQVDKVLVSPTQYESIFLVCTEGLNLACYKVYPDKTFDTLNVSFSFSLIGAFMLGIIVRSF
jgi:hypothetical protein